MKFGSSLRECWVKHKAKNCKDFEDTHLNLHDVFKVSKKDWHQIYNPFKEECRIIEIQYGEETSEKDIERLEFYKEIMNNDYKIKDISLAEFGRLRNSSCSRRNASTYAASGRL